LRILGSSSTVIVDCLSFSIDAAWRRIKKAAGRHGVEVSEKSWREIGQK